ncbi:CRTAC1 family protein, partial [filamentous cyanobacterium CCP1]
MFLNKSPLILDNPSQLNYGVAVADVDQDGAFELVVAAFGKRNLVLKWTGQGFIDIASDELADLGRQAIGVAAGDFDGDGQEEIYVLNTDSFQGRKQFGDRLFDWQDGNWVDLFALPQNQDSLNLTAGRSVAWIDRNGDGQYGCLVANYGGPIRLYELNGDGMIADMAQEAGLAFVTGGRGIVALPLVSDRMDIFMANEN